MSARMRFLIAAAAAACVTTLVLAWSSAPPLTAPMWLTLGVLTILSVLAAAMRVRAHWRATVAAARAADLARLAGVGAEAMQATSPEMALRTLARILRQSTGVRRCELHVCLPSHHVVVTSCSGSLPAGPTAATLSRGLCMPDFVRLVEWVADCGHPVAECTDGTLRFGAGEDAWPSHTATRFCPRGARTLLAPLRRHGRTVGVLALLDDATVPVDADSLERIALVCRYAARAAERVALSAGAADTTACGTRLHSMSSAGCNSSTSSDAYLGSLH